MVYIQNRYEVYSIVEGSHLTQIFWFKGLYRLFFPILILFFPILILAQRPLAGCICKNLEILTKT